MVEHYLKSVDAISNYDQSPGVPGEKTGVAELVLQKRPLHRAEDADLQVINRNRMRRIYPWGGLR